MSNTFLDSGARNRHEEFKLSQDFQYEGVIGDMAGHPWEQRWKVEGDLSKGGQGTTKHVTSIADSTISGALKILNNNKSEQARLRMRGEVVNCEILAALGGNVPRVLDHNTDQFADGKTPLYVVTELISGPTLEEFIGRNGPLDLDSAAKIVLALAETMRIAHTRPILHRDLKPANVIVRDPVKADVVTIDYGLSFNHDQEDVTRTSESFRNEFLDLPEFRTPGANKRDPRSDVTTLSAILCWCITNSMPGTLLGPDSQAPHIRAKTELQRRLGDDPRLSSLNVFFNKGFAQNVESRFQSVEELTDRLEHVLRSTPSDKTPDPIEAAMRASLRLRQGDRKTQLSSYTQALGNLQSQIAGHFNTFGQKIAPMQCANSGMSPMPRIPSEFEDLGLAVFGRLTVTNHSDERIGGFVFAARANQCALLHRRFRKKDSMTAPEPFTEWIPLIWFDGGASPTVQEVKVFVERWLAESIDELAAEIVP